MKTVFDASFRYRPSFDTDVRKTFERARREQQVRRRPAKAAEPARSATVVQLEHRAQDG